MKALPLMLKETLTLFNFLKNLILVNLRKYFFYEIATTIFCKKQV
ncbi:hypothetical protein SAMN05421765_1269 [Kaistella antarctica]|uniref:Uncharacterized protein n=1 Tax=Kaistella antarctica TaxID=266748 RepID=A0A3S4YP93_9FLAO|nr:hypothetical protein SAMN05421765_1269 [Kaistella antarctica]VEH95280.1 Uncharacterised protein [Kaistella antarctica]